MTITLTCDHRDQDHIINVDPYSRGHATHYRCTLCRSEFPVIGDTDMWQPKTIILRRGADLIYAPLYDNSII